MHNSTKSANLTMRNNSIRKWLSKNGKGTVLLLFCCMTWPCLMSGNARAADSLSKVKPVEISVNTDTASTEAGDDVYKNPDYFQRVPVEQLDALPDSTQAQTSFRQMDKKYQSAEFDYNENRIDRLSWWERLQQWLRDFFNRILPHFNINLDKTFYYFAIGIGVLTLAYVLYRLLAKGKKPFYGEENDGADMPPDWIEKKLMEVNLNTHLEKALINKNYVLAIRYLYLINLKALAEKHLIVWDHQKTNHDFLYELKAENLKKAFAQTIRVYEYTWYGGFDISENRFSQYRQLFEQFDQDIAGQMTVREAAHTI